MGKADELRERYGAEIALAELEDELVRLKADPGDGEELRAVKEQLRAARYEQRIAREGND